MREMKSRLMMASVVLFAGVASAEFVLTFIPGASAGVGTISISTDATGGYRGIYALVADNANAVIDWRTETIYPPFDVVDTGLWGEPTPAPFMGWVGGIGGDTVNDLFFEDADDGEDYSTLTNMTVMDGIEVTYTEDTTFTVYWVGNFVGNTPYPIASASTFVVIPSYGTWADSFLPDVIGSETNDFDEDGFDNLYEYALNGDPTDSSDIGFEPVFEDLGGSLLYIHLMRNDDTNLVYQVQTRESLVDGDWLDSGYTVLGTNIVAASDYDEVTNSVPTTLDQTFIRLKIDN
jgi:hypothetical protein